MTKPIRLATAIAEHVASGDFTDKISLGRRDDLRRLLRSLATMQVSLKARAAQQAESAAAKERMRAEQKQLRRDVTSNLAAAFEEKVGKLVLDLESAATRLEVTAHTVSDSAEHANKQAAIVAHNAGQATTNVEAVSGATKELVASGQDMFALVRNSMKSIGQAVQGTRQADIPWSCSPMARKKSAISSS